MRDARLNNLGMGFQRREPTYEAVMTDLALIGVITKEQAEALIGARIHNTTRLPSAFYEDKPDVSRIAN